MDASNATLRVEATESVREALSRAASCSSQPQAFLEHAGSPTVPWKVVLAAVREARRAEGEGEGGPWLQGVLRGASGSYPPPPAKPPRNPELVKRLERIKADLERKKYEEMVRDVDPQAASSRSEYEYMSAYRDQLGLGLNTVVVMATLFAFGYALGLKLTRPGTDDKYAEEEPRVVPLCCGLVGALSGMVIETFLFMIRCGRRDRAAAMGDENEKLVRQPARQTGGKLKEQ